jgi:hypothetical protein
VVECGEEAVALNGQHVRRVLGGDALLHVEDGLLAAGDELGVQLQVQLAEVPASAGEASASEASASEASTKNG